MSDEKKTKKEGSGARKGKEIEPGTTETTQPGGVKKAAAKAEARRADEASYRVPPNHAIRNMQKVFGGVGGIFLVISLIGITVNAKRFAYSYLFAFEVALTIALGMMFFVLVQHLTSAGWSVTVRRTAECFSAASVVLILLFVPVWAMRAEVFPWIHTGEAPAHAETHLTSAQTTGSGHDPAAVPVQGDHPVDTTRDPKGVGERADEGPSEAHSTEHAEKADPNEHEEQEVLEGKKPYLNTGFFTIRAIFYLLVWAAIGWKLLADSAAQDTSKDPQITVRLQRFAPLGTFAFGWTLTFAAFDWLMSLEPSWFSTIFGVYAFAGCVVVSLSLLIVVTMWIRSTGLLRKEITTEHYHDLGKLLFGFLVFWAYIGFAQFMLIWYAALPEETTFFHHRWDEGPWKTVSLILILCHFVFPFFLLISRNTKRRLQVLTFGAAWLAFMHVVDVYWLVMPNFAQADFDFHWLDATCLLGVVGVYFAVVFTFLQKHSLIPIGDPRLPRAVHFENA